MTSSALNLFITMVATAMIGVNLGILYRFWPEPWFSAKLLAASALLSYVALSVLYGDPAAWRLWVGVVALVVDAMSLGGIYAALRHARKGSGVLVAYQRR